MHTRPVRRRRVLPRAEAPMSRRHAWRPSAAPTHRRPSRVDGRRRGRVSRRPPPAWYATGRQEWNARCPCCEDFVLRPHTQAADGIPNITGSSRGVPGGTWLILTRPWRRCTPGSIVGALAGHDSAANGASPVGAGRCVYCPPAALADRRLPRRFRPLPVLIGYHAPQRASEQVTFPSPRTAEDAKCET